jgi:tRNA nucleotidyltransferase (CCA-adding enzyme)
MLNSSLDREVSRIIHFAGWLIHCDILCYNIGMERNISDLLVRSMDGGARLELLHLLAHQAGMLRMPLYLVGGVVRDILLGRAVHDFDLVVEGSSAELAEYIVRKFGGKILIHAKFLTATWVLNESTFERVKISPLQFPNIPLSFDFASARTETYAQPGALPTVKRSSIDADLYRRDFTINAMALRLDGENFGELFDPLNGQKDLDDKLIRVLHKQSFVDDTTRIFRAVRYAVRYGFEIAPETLSLVNDEARGVLAGLSGERLRHEFDLMFEEENAPLMLEQLGNLNLLAMLYPALQTADRRPLTALIAKSTEEFGEFNIPDILSFKQTLGWVLYLLNLSEADMDALAKRLAFPVLLIKAVRGASFLNKEFSPFKNWKPSQWTLYLDEFPALAVYAVYLVKKESVLRDYLVEWRSIKPYTTGYTLQQRGLEPGPKFKEILTRLRAAWLDGEVETEEEEMIMLEQISP